MLMPQVLCMKIDEQVDLLVKKIGHKLLFKKKKISETPMIFHAKKS